MHEFHAAGRGFRCVCVCARFSRLSIAEIYWCMISSWCSIVKLLVSIISLFQPIVRFYLFYLLANVKSFTVGLAETHPLRVYPFSNRDLSAIMNLNFDISYILHAMLLRFYRR